MKNPRRNFFAASAIAASLFLAACAPTTVTPTASSGNQVTNSGSATSSNQTVDAVQAQSGPVTESNGDITLPAFNGTTSPTALMEANADYTVVKTSEWNADDAVAITLNDTGASGGENAGVVAANGKVAITQAGVYTLSGTLNGQISVEAPADAQVILILNGATITNTTGSAISVVSAEDVAIHLADGSKNTVSDATSYTDTVEADSAINSTADLTITGTGALDVKGNGNDGISSTDDLVILGGQLTVTAADDAIRGKDSVVIAGGNLALTAKAGDGVKSDHDTDEKSGYVLIAGGNINISAGDDGVQAQTDLIQTGGTINVSAVKDGAKSELNATFAGGTFIVKQASEGIEAPYITVFDGTVNVNATDDAINASGLAEQASETDTGEHFLMEGGTVTITSAGDGLDSNGSITVNGGKLDITVQQLGGDGPIDVNGAVTIADGTVTVNGSAWDASMASQAGGSVRGQGKGPRGGSGARH